MLMEAVEEDLDPSKKTGDAWTNGKEGQTFRRRQFGKGGDTQVL